MRKEIAVARSADERPLTVGADSQDAAGQGLKKASFHPDGLTHLTRPLIQVFRRLKVEPVQDKGIALGVAVRGL